jgi:rRNA maturation protein Nop10
MAFRRKKNRPPVETFSCPHCGGEVKVTARSCPHCGADDTAGWNTDDRYSHVLGDQDEFDYDAFLEDEFGKKQVKPHNMSWGVWVMAVLALLAFILMIIR